MVDLSSLNPSQQNAVTCVDGAVMVLAGAGSGKTRTLVSRISYLIDELNVSPYKILALTFSNKAAKEMRERVARNSSHDIGVLRITTFHSFCAQLLRNEYKYLGLSRNFTIYDESESKTLAKNILKQRGLEDEIPSVYTLLEYIDSVKNFGYYVGRNDSLEKIVDKGDVFYSCFVEYESELKRSNAVDFGGLITGVIELLKTHQDVLERYQTRFQYVLVDEYQDTNRAQFELLTLLCGKHKNICVVGDEDQSIYSWRGADIRNILDFEKEFPNTQLIKLEQNYRSSKVIIDAASCVIAKNKMRKGKQMWTDNAQGDLINICESLNDRSEAEFVTSEIKKLISNGTSLDDVAVFYRTNAQSRIIEDTLRRDNLNYRVVGGLKFYDRKEIKDMLAYFRLVVNPMDSLALSRIINVPARGVGATSLRKIECEAIEKNLSLWDIIQDIVDNSQKYSHIKLSSKVFNALRNFVDLINEAKVLNQKDKHTPSKVYSMLLNQSNYRLSLIEKNDVEAKARIENLEELKSALVQYEESNEDPSIIGFLESISLDTSVGDDGASADELSLMTSGAKRRPKEISLMTIHGAKGLEFPYVFIVGVEENLFPSYMSMDKGVEALEEERRLFYVAMTRAMKKLYVSFANSRMLFGQIKYNPPSRFIEEIPKDYFCWIKTKTTYSPSSYANNSSYSSYSSNLNSNSNSNDEYEKVVYVEKTKYAASGTRSSSINGRNINSGSKYHNGQKVKHLVYGNGKIVDVSGFGNDEKVTIEFLDGSKKKFVTRFAPLQLI